MTKYIIVLGDPESGFRYIGPFDTAQEASEYGERIDVDSWVCVLARPEEDGND